jgi:hypothetical protein
LALRNTLLVDAIDRSLRRQGIASGETCSILGHAVGTIHGRDQKHCGQKTEETDNERVAP